mmetsp:Transcript_21415/g.34253  ORF Transcript_21415/g.34253 Transcript_21415/m.34253 type:complete len:97 (+) Transcript_21415:129-419(+)
MKKTGSSEPALVLVVLDKAAVDGHVVRNLAFGGAIGSDLGSSVDHVWDALTAGGATFSSPRDALTAWLLLLSQQRKEASMFAAEMKIRRSTAATGL